MGWANCGTDSKGRPIGYAHSATCDEPGCEKEIHRGVSYACGGMHGENGHDCEGYFCEEHLHPTDIKGEWTSYLYLCQSCVAALPAAQAEPQSFREASSDPSDPANSRQTP